MSTRKALVVPSIVVGLVLLVPGSWENIVSGWFRIAYQIIEADQEGL